MKILIVTIVGILLSSALSATNVKVTNVTSNGTSTVTFDISWENSWKTSTTRDLVWIVLKGKPNGSGNTHLLITDIDTDSNWSGTMSDDNVGFFLEKSLPFSGVQDVSTNVTLTYLPSQGAVYTDVSILATEMVLVPGDSFFAGDGVAADRYHRGDDSSKPVKVNLIMTRGTTANDFGGGPPQHTGDIPLSFPEGREYFYCMKYPVTEIQFVDFLNSLPRSAQDFHTASDLSGTTVDERYVMVGATTSPFGNVIRCDENIGTGNITFYCDGDGDDIPNENTDGLGRICSRIKMQNYYAYLDWIGLAPMTNLQYEKACRGPLQPVPGEYSWGSELLTPGGATINEGMPSEKLSNSGVDGGIIEPINTILRVGCHAPETGATRELSNGSYYGIHNLTGRTVTLVMPPTDTDMYSGQTGDGILDMYGRADFMDDTHALMSKDYVTSNLGSGTISRNNVIGYTSQHILSYAIQGVRIFD